MSVHSSYKNRICVIKGCIIPCQKTGRKSVAEKPHRNSCHAFKRSCEKTVQHIRDSKVFSDEDIDYILDNDDLPCYICMGCLRGLQRTPEKYTSELPIVDWHRNNLKTRNKSTIYSDHLNVEKIDQLHDTIHVCPYICQPLFNDHPNLHKGCPSQVQVQRSEFKKRQIELDQEKLKFEKSMNCSKNTTVLDQSEVSNQSILTPRLCPICAGEIKKGGHSKAECTPMRGASKNLLKLMRDRDIDEPIAVSVINDKIGDNVVNGSLRSGNNKRKTISTKHFKIVEVTADQSINLMRSGKMSKSQYRLVHAFAKDANGLKKLPTLKSINETLDERMKGLVSTAVDYWNRKPKASELENMDALIQTGEWRLQDGVHQKRGELVYVNDLQALYRRVVVARGMTEEVGVVFNMDDGKGSFKIIWQILDLKNAKHQSPDTIQVLCDLPGVKESASSVHKVLKLIKFDDFARNNKSFLTTDYKMKAILCNIKGGSARHPSPFCDFDRRYPDQACHARTLETERANWEKFESGHESKNCNGIQAEPRWEMLKNIDNGTLELVVPQLHTLLGMVNRLQQHNKSLMTDAQATEMYVKWLKPAGIGKAPYFAGTYEGNLRVGQRVEHPE